MDEATNTTIETLPPPEASALPEEASSSWYCAHLLYQGHTDEDESSHPVRERIVLLQARSPREAWVEAERLGALEEGRRFVFPQGEGTTLFVGVRRIIAVEGQLQHGIELTDLLIEVDQEEDVDRLLEGEFVKCVLFEW